MGLYAVCWRPLVFEQTPRLMGSVSASQPPLCFLVCAWSIRELSNAQVLSRAGRPRVFGVFRFLPLEH